MTPTEKHIKHVSNRLCTFRCTTLYAATTAMEKKWLSVVIPILCTVGDSAKLVEVTYTDTTGLRLTCPTLFNIYIDFDECLVCVWGQGEEFSFYDPRNFLKEFTKSWREWHP